MDVTETFEGSLYLTESKLLLPLIDDTFFFLASNSCKGNIELVRFVVGLAFRDF
jgi:hypothetical protein